MYNPFVNIEAGMTKSLENQIGHILQARGLKLAIAESCTGGLIGDRITNVIGASDYFLGGVQAYAYEAKVTLLGVSWETLKAHGAVSKEAALEMARGVQKLLSADLSLSVTGIAGPGGGTAQKPVGTTWVSLVARDGEWTRKFQFPGNRRENKALSAAAALQLLLDYLEGGIRTDEAQRQTF